MKNKENIFNYLSLNNGIIIQKFSSEDKNFPIENCINSKRNEIWLSKNIVPQEIIFNLLLMRKKPKKNYLSIFGFYCNYSLETNPKIIEILISNDNKKYFSLGNYIFKFKGGAQIIKLKNLEKFTKKKFEFNYFKIIIKETYGGFTKCYINNFYLMEDLNIDFYNYLYQIEGENNNSNFNNDLFTKKILNESVKTNNNELKIFNHDYNKEKNVNEENKILNKIENILKNKNFNYDNNKKEENQKIFEKFLNENKKEDKVYSNINNLNLNNDSNNYIEIKEDKINFDKNNIENNNDDWNEVMLKIYNLNDSIKNCFSEKNIFNKEKKEEKEDFKNDNKINEYRNNNKNNFPNKNIINKTNIKDEFTQNLYKILLDKTNKINNEKIKFFQSKNFI